MPDKTLALLLAGGVGSRLHPLTADRAKPAVPFGGKYRIIDFTLSNCLHSGIRRVLVLTQYKSHSLQKHLRDGWSIFNPELGEYITPVPPQMRAGERWYAGTADAVFQNQYLLERSGAERVLILSGDHIYRMDYAEMLRFHRHCAAAATIACMEVPLADASAFGVVAVDAKQRILEFQEKPTNPRAVPEKPGVAMVSMGIYVFSSEILLDALRIDASDANSSHDFGKDILPRMITREAVFAYPFGGLSGRVQPDRYWRDVGTIDAYYAANMDLLNRVPPLNLYQTNWPIRTYNGQYPPARTVPGASGREGAIINSIVASGVVIAGGQVQDSLLFNQVFVDDDAQVKHSVLFDGVQVGRGARLNRCIVDKQVRIPENESIGLDPTMDRLRFTVSDAGVVVVAKNCDFRPRPES
ncbi:MAG: glucose-1-phosphate adenylyltransferase [Thiotrichales bacterium]